MRASGAASSEVTLDRVAFELTTISLHIHEGVDLDLPPVLIELAAWNCLRHDETVVGKETVGEASPATLLNEAL
jgi:hypothetical protein